MTSKSDILEAAESVHKDITGDDDDDDDSARETGASDGGGSSVKAAFLATDESTARESAPAEVKQNAQREREREERESVVSKLVPDDPIVEAKRERRAERRARKRRLG